MFDPILRRVKEAALLPVARPLRRVDPLVLTGVGLVFGLAAALAAWHDRMALGLLFWVANRLLDGLDGIVARIADRQSDLGGMLDLVTDFTVYATIPVAMGFRPNAPEGLALATACLLASFYVNAAAWMVPSALLERRGRATDREEPTSIVIPEGIVSGGETVLFFGLFFLIPSRQIELFLLMAVLTLLTIVQRVAWARRTFAPEAPEMTR